MIAYRIALVTAFVLAMAHIAWSSDEMLTNGDFEAGFHGVQSRGAASLEGSLPTRWQDNSSWNLVNAKYSHVQGDGSSKALRIEHKGPTGNRIQVIQPVQLKAGKFYQLAGSMRSDALLEDVQIQMRDPGPPYNCFADIRSRATAAWTRHSAVFSVPQDGEYWCMILVSRMGSVDLDNLSLTLMDDDPKSSAPAPEGNILPYGRFPAGVTMCLLHP